MLKITGLRNRWLFNTAGLACILGLVCILATTSVFAHYNYANAQSDMLSRAETTVGFLSDYPEHESISRGELCASYANSFNNPEMLELQFLDVDGCIMGASNEAWIGQTVSTPDIQEALNTRGICTYRGNDSHIGSRVIAVSGPVTLQNGQIVGVLRYVTTTQTIDRQITMVAVMVFLVFALVVTAVLVCSHYYIRSFLTSIGDITEKARRIASGTYGIQIAVPDSREVRELAEAINDLSAGISNNERMQTEFISSLSHELRTPLTAINGWSETILADENLDQDTRRGMKIISREAKRLTEMVVDLLDFTRIEDGRMTLHMETADLRAEFEDTVFMYGSRLEQDGIRLNYLDNDEDIPEILCDPKRLRQVFLNILDNAAKHGGEGKQIDASIRCEAESIVVRIRDYGPGIPEDEIPLVKKKFYKGSSKARGTGIGLAVCDEIVEMHSGILELSNAPGGGTLVTVTLPLAQ